MLTLTSERETPLHRWPAGVKLAGLAVFTGLVVWGGGLVWPALAFTAVAATVAALGLFPAWRGMFRPLLWIGGVILAWHAATGTPWEGLAAVLRMVAAFGAANLVTLTTPLTEMQAVFLVLARPLAPLIPPERLALSMALMIRFLPVLSLRAAQLTQAWRARSARRVGWALVFAITLAALDDAEQVAAALRARGGVG